MLAVSPALPTRIRCHAARTGVQVWRRLAATAAELNVQRTVQRPIRAAYYRGGTSRALILQPRDLPIDRSTWPSVFRQLMGTPDPNGRQLDGMGAGISSLSKICLVEPCRQEHEDADGTALVAHVDYTFVGLGIEGDEVDVAGNCGNMSSAIGPYAYNARLLPPSVYKLRNGKVTVRVRNTNTDKLINATFPVDQGQAVVHGRYGIDGVAGHAAQIQLDFKKPYGSKTGKVLPTGKRVDSILGYPVSCVDGPNPGVFVRADDLGVDGTILPNDFNKMPEKLQELEKIRRAAAVAMGIAETEDAVPRTIPKIGIVSMSSTHKVLSGKTVSSAAVDLVVRFISDTQPHRAIPLTLALTTAVAARIPGTVVEQLLAPDPVMEDAITIGHASGRIQVNATMGGEDSITPKSATVYRTAKRIFEGNTFYTDDSSNFAIAAQLHQSDIRRRHSLGLAFVKEMRGETAEWLQGLPDPDFVPESFRPPGIQDLAGMEARLKTRTELSNELQILDREVRAMRFQYKYQSRRTRIQDELMRARAIDVKNLERIFKARQKNFQNIRAALANTAASFQAAKAELARVTTELRTIDSLLHRKRTAIKVLNISTANAESALQSLETRIRERTPELDAKIPDSQNTLKLPSMQKKKKTRRQLAASSNNQRTFEISVEGIGKPLGDVLHGLDTKLSRELLYEEEDSPNHSVKDFSDYANHVEGSVDSDQSLKTVKVQRRSLHRPLSPNIDAEPPNNDSGKNDKGKERHEEKDKDEKEGKDKGMEKETEKNKDDTREVDPKNRHSRRRYLERSIISTQGVPISFFRTLRGSSKR